MESLFELLRKARIKRRVAVLAMAKDLNISKSSIYRYEKQGFKTFSLEKLSRIAIYLHVPLHEVLAALRNDNYDEDELNLASDIYKEEYTKKYGYYDAVGVKEDKPNYGSETIIAAKNHAAETLNNIYLKYNDKQITDNHIDLVKYVTNELTDAQAIKALKLLKVVFDE